MAFNGSGTFNLVAGNPVVTGTTISSTWANNTLSDIATGLSTVITKDGQTTPTANIPLAGYKLTGSGAATANGDLVRYEQVGALAGSQTTALTGLTSSLLYTGTKQNTTSGTSIDFLSVPSWARRITLSLSGVSTNGTSNPLIQIGDSGGIENASYLSIAALVAAGPSIVISGFTTGVGVNTNSAVNNLTGHIFLTLVDPATNLWVISGNVGSTAGSLNVVTTGNKALSATLDRIRITTVGGVDTFDAGMANILYE